MASTKKKQDEKYFKILRELVSQSGNKECFDCQQRGPTYVNMTIGSFVCTTCSGLLRGLTPPHRVKSISMATFNQEEIDFLKDRGNEFCRAIWLGLMSHSTAHTTNNEQKNKDFMSAKYELKRYYIDPAIANQLKNQKSLNFNKVQKNCKSLVTACTKFSSSSIPFSKNKSEVSPFIHSNNFIADFKKTPAPSFMETLNTDCQTTAQPSFASFDDNPVFNSSKVGLSLMTVFPNTLKNPSTEDRYAALKDLDSKMKLATMNDESITPKISWNIKDNNVVNPTWSTFKETRFISNPFIDNTLNTLNNNDDYNFQQTEASVDNAVNPFRSTQNSTFDNDSQWFGQDKNKLNASSSYMTNILSKSMPSTSASIKANPFIVETGIGIKTCNLNNPFL